MIIVSGTLTVDPEKKDIAIAAAVEMAAATQQEAGCIVYDFWASLEQDNLFRIYEEWESLDALHAHFEAPHMAVFQSKIAGIVTSRGINRHEVADTVAL